MRSDSDILQKESIQLHTETTFYALLSEEGMSLGSVTIWDSKQAVHPPQYFFAFASHFHPVRHPSVPFPPL